MAVGNGQVPIGKWQLGGAVVDGVCAVGRRVHLSGCHCKQAKRTVTERVSGVPCRQRGGGGGYLVVIFMLNIFEKK